MKLCIHVRPRDDGQGWAVDVFDGRRAWIKTHLGEQPLNKAEAHRLAHKLRDPKFYTARTKRAVNSLTVVVRVFFFAVMRSFLESHCQCPAPKPADTAAAEVVP